MLQTNNGLVPDDDSTARNSRPWMWPIDWEGIMFANDPRYGLVYFLGNPIVFWVNLGMIGALLAVNIAQSYCQLRQKVQYRDNKNLK